MASRLSRLVQRTGLSRLFVNRSDPKNPKIKIPFYSTGSSNLEVVKFGIYIMFPIGWMYYFGTNLDNRFSVPDFWPAPETTNRIPFEREDQKDMEQKLRSLRLARKERRQEREKLGLGAGAQRPIDSEGADTDTTSENAPGTENGSRAAGNVQPRNTFGISPLERWARSK